MGAVFEMDKGEVREIVHEVIADHHPDLQALMVEKGNVPALRFDLVLCWAEKDDNGDPCGPGLKLHGYPCLAVVKTIKYKDRVKGMGDVEISINADEWQMMDEAKRRAIIDHELYHLVPKLDSNGALKRDDLRRPLFGMRLHDVQLGWFAAVALRNGDASAERIQARAIVENFRQEIFAFVLELENPPPPPRPSPEQWERNMNAKVGEIINAGASAGPLVLHINVPAKGRGAKKGDR